MSADVIAEVDGPRQAGRRPVGAVGETGEETAQAPDDDAGGEGADEDAAGRAPDAANQLVGFDPDDRACQRTGDTVREGRGGLLQGVQRSGQPAARHCADRQAGEISGSDHAGGAFGGALQPPAIEAESYRCA